MTKTQEKTKEALQKIEKALQNINTDRDWMQYLEFQAKFYNYSARNVLLILCQNPQASYVKGYKAWNQLGRYVKKGAKGIAILAPCIKKVSARKEEDKPSQLNDQYDKKKEDEKKVLCGFRITYVYDFMDTAGDDDQIPVLIKGLDGNSTQSQTLYQKLTGIISHEYPVEETENMAAKGCYNLSTGVITVRSDLSDVQKIKTILHEYAHGVDFSLNPDETISRNYRELIAESTAFVVASRLGVDTSRYTVGYLRSWMTDQSDLSAIADAVQKVSAYIINKLAESFDFASFI